MSAEPLEPDLRQQARITHLPDAHRRLPQDVDAERGVLCSFLLAPREIGQMCTEQGVTAEHFHLAAHALIFVTLKEFWDDNEPADFVTICHHMRGKGTLDNAGGPALLTELWTFVGTSANASHYLDIVREKYILREVIKICTEGASRGYDHQDDVPALLNDTVENMLKVVRMAEGKRINRRSVKDLVIRAMARIDKYLHPDWKIEMPTGIKALDRACLGFKRGTVTMIAGKPSDGKSSLALNIVEHLVFNCDKIAGILSLDDTDDEVMDRLIQQRAQVDLFQVEVSHRLTDEERERLQQAAIEIAAMENRLLIRDDGAMSASEMNATFAAWQAQFGLDFGVIDHIQLAKGDGTTRGSTEEANQVSRSLKPMAKRFNIPLLVLSQTTEVEKGVFRTKNTTSLQEDANRLWMIKRVEDSTDAWINVGKQKNGPKSIIPVKYVQEFTRFSDRDGTTEDQQPELVNMGKTKPQGRRK